jgi:trigger factor
MQVELGSGQLIPGFEEQLEGQKVGAHAHVDVTFPKDYGVKELAGKDAMFHVDIKEIREPGETKLDDDLAKKLRFESLDKLKETITKEISEDYAQFTKMKVKRALLDTLDENHEFDLPQGMIDLEYQSILEQMEKEKEAQNEKLSDEDRENLKAIAERRVRLGLVLAEIGKDNKIDVTRDELYKAIHAEARKYPGQETQVLEFYSKNPQIIESFRAPLYEEKVIEFILGKAKVDEKVVPLDVLTKEDDDELPKAKKKKAAAKK